MKYTLLSFPSYFCSSEFVIKFTINLFLKLTCASALNFARDSMFFGVK